MGRIEGRNKTMRRSRKMAWAALIAIAIIVISSVIVSLVSEAAYVTAESGLCVRAEPDTDSEVIEVLPFGSEVTPSGSGAKERSGWIRLKEGWISAEWVGETNPLDAYTYMGTWRTTAYAYTGSACANGNFPQTGYTIACNSLPFGTKVYIKGVGFRTVEDRGPTSMGDAWLDIYMDDVNECIQWGDRYLDVYVVEE